jgi:hypothetical protein
VKYARFEDLPVWRDAMQPGDRVAMLLEHEYFGKRRGLTDQLDRAAVSISDNIASESISRQLQSWAQYLLNSDLKGTRHATDAERAERGCRREAFVQKLKTMYPQPKDPDPSF